MNSFSWVFGISKTFEIHWRISSTDVMMVVERFHSLPHPYIAPQSVDNVAEPTETMCIKKQIS